MSRDPYIDPYKYSARRWRRDDGCEVLLTGGQLFWRPGGQRGWCAAGRRQTVGDAARLVRRLGGFFTLVTDRSGKADRHTPAALDFGGLVEVNGLVLAGQPETDHEERQRRIKYYRGRAERGLPLFAPQQQEAA